MKHVFSLILLSNLILQVWGQDNPCFESAYEEGEYWPLIEGKARKFGITGNEPSPGEMFTSTIVDDSVVFNEKYYCMKINEYQSGKIDTSYWRNGDGAIYNYEVETGDETIHLIANPKVGDAWKSTSGEWSYKVISLNSIYNTPFCSFSALLEIEAVSKKRKGMTYNLFYKKGIGRVGLNVNGSPYLLILPNNPVPVVRPILSDCQGEESIEEKNACTDRQIMEHIKKHYKLPYNYKKGEMVVKCSIDTEGRVSKVVFVKTIKKADKQEKEAIRVMKLLPEFIPATKNGDEFFESSIIVPLRF